jgi:signal transduction histidine kinase
VLSVERARSEEGERLRKKLAADFHDEIGHKITAISLSTKLLERELSSAPANVRDHINKIGERADQMFKEIHELAWELDPTKDSLQDLAEHLKGFSDQLFETTSVAFRIVGLPSESETIKLPLEWRQHLTRILKEAMNNIARHALGCRNVTLAISLARRELSIELTNDGPGFDTIPSNGGSGLTNMRDRAKLIHGEVSISSSSTSGTTVRFRGKLP